MIGRREIAKRSAQAIVDTHPIGARPGVVLVLIAHEPPPAAAGADPRLEIDLSVCCGEASTVRGAGLIVEFARRVRGAISQIASELAAEQGLSALERDDLLVAISGERPRA